MFAEKILKRHISAAIALLSLLCVPTFGEPTQTLPLTKIGRFAEPNKVHVLGRILVSAKKSMIYAAASSMAVNGKNVTVQIIAFSIDDRQDPHTIFQRTFDVSLANPNRAYASGVAELSDGTLVLTAKVDGMATSMLKMKPDGTVLSERLLFDGNRDASINDMVATDQDDVILVGDNRGNGIATLFNKDLKFIWEKKLSESEFTTVDQVKYVPVNRMFIFAGKIGNSNPAEQKEKKPPRSFLAVAQYDGTILQQEEWSGAIPSIAYSKDQSIYLVTQTGYLLSKLRKDVPSQTTISVIGTDLKHIKEAHLPDVQQCMQGLRIAVAENGQPIVAGLQQFKLYLYAYNRELRMSARILDDHTTFGLGSLQIASRGNTIYVMSTIFPLPEKQDDQDKKKAEIADEVRLETIEPRE